jgi:hypothetical protein
MLMRHRLAPWALAGCLLAAGCAETDQSGVSPTASSAVLDALAGAWTLGSSSALPAGCTALDYTVTKSDDGKSGIVAFNGTCAGVEASGSGTGTVAGSALNWTAEGTATRSGLTCPFTFGEGTARPEGDGVRVTFAGTLCGMPVSGTELLRRK